MSNDITNSAPDQWSDRRRVTVIYFLGTQDESEIKIGRTDRKVSRRIEEHAGRGPMRDANRLVFLAAVPGINSDESAVHNYFKDDRTPDEREWFTSSPSLQGFVRWLRMQWFTLRTLEETDEDPVSRSHEGIDGGIWLPSKERIVTESSGAMLPLEGAGSWGHLLDVNPEITGDDFYTDRRIIDAAINVMGGIDLDPATHPIANRKYIRAPRIYTLTTNGLAHPWGGRVWCNPPFGQWQEWTRKIVSEWQSGRVEAMCVLLATRTLSAQGAAELFKNCSAVCITKGRIPFWGPKATGSPDDGHAIFYFGPDVAGFYKSFSGVVGHVLYTEAGAA